MSVSGWSFWPGVVAAAVSSWSIWSAVVPVTRLRRAFKVESSWLVIAGMTVPFSALQ